MNPWSGWQPPFLEGTHRNGGCPVGFPLKPDQNEVVPSKSTPKFPVSNLELPIGCRSFKQASEEEPWSPQAFGLEEAGAWA